jgi:hypothetical protein
MAYSQIEQKYLDTLAMAAFPEAVSEPVVAEPSLDGVQLAMGGSGAGKYRSNATMVDAGIGLMDTLAGALRGTTAQTLGLPGDVESLVRLLTGGEQVLPTTERVNEMLPPVVPPGAPNAAERQKTADVANTLGEFNPIVGAPEAVKIGVKGAKAAGKALAPAAADVIEGGMRKSGMIMDIVPAGPRVDSIDKFPVGPGSIKPTVIAPDAPLYREMSADNLTDFLRQDNQFSYAAVFVTDNTDLALGQGSNKGIKVQFRANAVSGEEHRKPMTGDLAGREYKANVFAPKAIESITFDSEADLKKLKGLPAKVLQTEFERASDGKKNIVFIRKAKGEEKK